MKSTTLNLIMWWEDTQETASESKEKDFIIFEKYN